MVAKISELMVMLNKNFVIWVLLAFVIAGPVAWYAMHKWLQNFAYKTTLSLVDFCFGWFVGPWHCLANCKLAKLEGCY